MLWNDIDYNKYELFLIDLWGTIHNGIKPYDGVVEQLQFLKDNGKKVLFLTNACRTSKCIAKLLNEMGLNSSFYDNIVSAGEVFLQDVENSEYFKSKKAYNIGTGKIEFYGCKTTDKIEEAEYMALSGNIYPFKEEYFEALSFAKNHNLKLLCLNPDLCSNRGNFFHPVCGFLGLYYEKIGGEVIYYGKPYKRVYEYALEVAGINDKSKIIAIGDNNETDIKGANDFGIASYQVKTGLNKK